MSKIIIYFHILKTWVVYLYYYIKATIRVLNHRWTKNFHHNVKVCISEMKTIDDAHKFISKMYKNKYKEKEIKKETLDI